MAAAETAMVMAMATTTAMATAMVMAMAMGTAAATETATVTAVVVVAEAAAEASGGQWNTMPNTMTMASISLKELFAHNGNALDAFRGRDAARGALADYLARRLRTLILPREHGNVAIEVMGIRCYCHHCGGRRGRGARQCRRQQVRSDDAVFP